MAEAMDLPVTPVKAAPAVVNLEKSLEYGVQQDLGREIDASRTMIQQSRDCSLSTVRAAHNLSMQYIRLHEQQSSGANIKLRRALAPVHQKLQSLYRIIMECCI